MNTGKLKLWSMVLVALIVAVIVAPRSASAVVILTYDDTLKDIGQTENNPCVIGDSCNDPDGWDHTGIPGGNDSTRDLTSPIYTVGQIASVVGPGAVNFLADVNQTGGTFNDAIQVDLIQVFVNNVLEFVFNGPQNVPTSGNLNGNGESDAGFRGLDFSGFASSATVTFRVVWSNQDDGFETFFLQDALDPIPPAEVPEPTSLLLLGSGLLGLGLWRRKQS